MSIRRAGFSAIAMAVALSLGATAPAAQAGHRQLSIFEDDASLLLSSPATREQSLNYLNLLGVDMVRAVVSWNRVAPAPTAADRPANFDGADPAAYPPENWDRYDDLVRGATARGIDVLFSPASPIPTWASQCHGARDVRRLCRPDPTQFKRFVQALGTRYSGTYADENQDHAVLPRVVRWSVWNEPNQGGWLQPQFARVGGHVVMQSPAIYRELVRSAVKGLQESGHGSDDILAGETAPLGRATGPSATRPIAPGAFLRTMLCIDSAGRPLRGQAAALHQCSGFPKLQISGISHHPYTRGGSQSPRTKGTSHEITISSAPRLKRIISQAAARRRIPQALPVYYTEYGFQTNPPDTTFGVSLYRQAAWINESDWIAYNDPAVLSVAQYQLRDETNLAGFQTGLLFASGAQKPALAAYRLPVWVTRVKGGSTRVWGQVRPGPDGVKQTVLIQNATSGGSFDTVATAATHNDEGFIDVTVRAPGPRWRLVWIPSTGGPPAFSRIARVTD